MFKRRFLAIFSFLLIFLFAAGCGTGQQSNDLDAAPGNETETEVIDQSSSKEKKDEKSDSESTSKSSESSKENESGKKDEKGKAAGGQSKALPLMKVHYIDVGQGDSTLIEFADGSDNYKILIDAGTWQRTDVIDYLRSQNVRSLDLVIGTHPDADHIGQMDKIINQFDVGEVWMSGNTSSSRTFQRMLQAIDQHDVDYYEPRMGEEFEIGPLDIKVLYPKSVTGKNNVESLAFKFTYGDVVFIFTGDADRDAELKMLQSGVDLKGDVLHLGHHGSKTSTDPTFLKTVSPSIAIYSAGKNNSYGHPHAEVINLVKKSGIKLYGTDVHGTIIVTTDGKTVNVSTKKSGQVTAGGTSTPKKQEPTQPPQQKAPAPDPKPAPKPDPKPDPQPKQDQQPAPSSGCININTASYEELQQIIEIGPDRAQQIIELRASKKFQSVDELTRVKGIGDKRLEKIKNQGLACVGG